MKLTKAQREVVNNLQNNDDDYIFFCPWSCGYYDSNARALHKRTIQSLINKGVIKLTHIRILFNAIEPFVDREKILLTDEVKMQLALGVLNTENYNT